MAQQVKVLAAKPDYLHSIPGSHKSSTDLHMCISVHCVHVCTRVSVCTVCMCEHICT